MKKIESLVAGLEEEKRQLKSGNLPRSHMSRIEAIDQQLRELLGNDSFRSHELQDNIVFVDDIVGGDIDLDGEGFSDESHGFVSESYIDPNLDY